MTTLLYETHEHPMFNGQYHTAIWAQSWVSDGTGPEGPPDTPVACLVCGKVREEFIVAGMERPQ